MITAVNSMKHIALFLFPLLAAAQVELATVESRAVDRTIQLPGEIQPWESVDIYARVPGFVERVLVDRGSRVRKGDLLIELSAPEMKAQIAEAESRIHAMESQRAEAQAKLVAAQSTLDRLKQAAETPGAVAGNEVVLAGKAVDAANAQVAAIESSIKAAQASRLALADMESYLKITAPFPGTITERRAHPGALAGNASSGPLLKLDQTARLRLVVAVPETDTAAIPTGARVKFTVPAYKGETFEGRIARKGGMLDPKTRTMPVELDVANPAGKLAPGMFPEVAWPASTGKPSLLVPATAVVVTQERSFVIRVRDGKAEWVDVAKGAAAPNGLVAVRGPLTAGDRIVKRGTDEIRNGSAIR
jgi:RND family efflux transporter MFP subunit